jgi:hypothetical protein
MKNVPTIAAPIIIDLFFIMGDAIQIGQRMSRPRVLLRPTLFWLYDPRLVVRGELSVSIADSNEAQACDLVIDDCFEFEKQTRAVRRSRLPGRAVGKRFIRRLRSRDGGFH